jgi:heme-degrading monooxygenase HmoA
MAKTMDFQSRFIKTPPPPYYTVMFTLQTTEKEKDAVGKADQQMLELAAMNPGFIGAENREDEKGFILMMTYWKDLESIKMFRENAEHRQIQDKGKAIGFQKRVMRVAQGIKEYGDEM